MLEEETGKPTEPAKAKKPAFDPHMFNDPIAIRTEWKSLAGSDWTHRLKVNSVNRLSFQPTLFAKLFFLPFLIGGILMVFLGVHLFKDNRAIFVCLFPTILGAVFVFAALFGFLFLLPKPKVFDLATGWYWKNKQPDTSFLEDSFSSNPFEEYSAVRLINVHALQVIKKPRNLCEMNLVLKDSSRVNVLCHDKKERLEREAYMLSEFLGVPVWVRP